MIMSDVLSFMVPSAEFMASSHLASKQAGVNPLYCYFQPQGLLAYIKGPKGFPWDINLFDRSYIYQWITEGPNGWTDPSSYKEFVSKTTKCGGIYWSPRQLIAPQTPLVSDSSYETWQSGKIVSTSNLGGNVSTQIEGPYSVSVGDLGSQNVIVLSYLWGSTIEVNYYALGFGWCRWQSWTLQANGFYSLVTDNLFDQIVAGGTPVLDFPGLLPALPLGS